MDNCTSISCAIYWVTAIFWNSGNFAGLVSFDHIVGYNSKTNVYRKLKLSIILRLHTYLHFKKSPDKIRVLLDFLYFFVRWSSVLTSTDQYRRRTTCSCRFLLSLGLYLATCKKWCFSEKVNNHNKFRPG